VARQIVAFSEERGVDKPMFGRPERTGGVRVGQLFIIRREDFGRVGHCWMKDRLLEADLVISVAHSGDCF
jgi:hypothetical protein